MELQIIQNKIYEVRGHKVMLDYDLAELYEVPTKALNQAVKRNIRRFPSDFMFRLTPDEWDTMRSQFAAATGIENSMQSHFVTAPQKRRNVSATPYALTYKDLTERLKEIEGKFTDVYEALNYLLDKDKHQTEQKERKRIGFHP